MKSLLAFLQIQAFTFNYSEKFPFCKENSFFLIVKMLGDNRTVTK
ncbi:hypothetical protein HMPREF1987_00394, partial [Peptostreptococcaceae bacterium oral taxon 113 str. W5053]